MHTHIHICECTSMQAEHTHLENSNYFGQNVIFQAFN